MLTIALFHFHVTQVKRSAEQSTIASAAYRAGEKLYSEYSDYTRKGGVIYSDILLPPHAPPEYADRQTLWNAVEKAERGKKAQLAYSFDIALQNEFSIEENIALARQFLSEHFVSRGMIVDFAIHQPDKEDGGISNPHFHVICPIRPLDEHGRWGQQGIRTDKGDLNRWIKATNALIRDVKKKIAAILGWLKDVREELTKPHTPDLVSLLNAYYTGRNAGAYSQKARTNNLKEFNEIFNYLQANGIYTLDDLENCTAAISSTVDDLKKKLDGQTARMKQIRSMADHANTFKNLKSVYDGLQKIKFTNAREKYKAEHAADLKQFYAARRILRAEFSDGKVDMKKLSAKYDCLEQDHAVTYAEFKSVREDSQRLWRIKTNIDTVLRQQEQSQNLNTTKRRDQYER